MPSNYEWRLLFSVTKGVVFVVFGIIYSKNSLTLSVLERRWFLGWVFPLKTQRQKEAGASSLASTCCHGALRCLSTAPGLTFQQVSYWCKSTWSNTWQCRATFFFQLLFSFTCSTAQLKVFPLRSAAMPFIAELSNIFPCGFSISSMFSVGEKLIKMADLKKHYHSNILLYCNPDDKNFKTWTSCQSNHFSLFTVVD